MRFYELTLALLAVWRVTHLLTAEAGPWGLIEKARRRLGGGFWGDLMSCAYCCSLWVAAPFAWLVADGIKERFLLWLALSGGASLMERLTDRPAVAPAPAPYWKEEDPDVMLREARDSDQPRGGDPNGA